MKLFFLTLLLLIPLSSQAQKNLSGRVEDDEGPVAQANVTELDKNYRIVSQTITDKDGYYTMPLHSAKDIIKISTPHHRIFAEEIDGRKHISVLLIRSTPIEGSELLLRPCPYANSFKLLYGHNGSRNVPQHIYVEMLCDTLFSLIIPVRALNIAEQYPAENTLHFVDATDRHLMSGVNPLPSNPLSGHPDNIDFNAEMRNRFRMRIGTESYDSDADLYYCYPEFVFSTRRLEHLLQNESLISRILIETARKDNFWVLYPYPEFGNELTRILERLKKRLK